MEGGGGPWPLPGSEGGEGEILTFNNNASLIVTAPLMPLQPLYSV